MVNDVIAATAANVENAAVTSADEVRAAGRTLGGFSPELAGEERELKRFMYTNLYHHPEQLAAAEAANRIVADLFAASAADPGLIADDWSARLPGQLCATNRHLGAHIVGRPDPSPTHSSPGI